MKRKLFKALRVLLTDRDQFLRRLAAYGGLRWNHPFAMVAAMNSTYRRHHDIEKSYEAWLGQDVPAGMVPKAPANSGPLLSIIMPVYNTEEAHLKAAIESVLQQTYPKWQLCIADDASTSPHVLPLLERYAAADPRICLASRDITGHISAASNCALSFADGDFIVLLDHDDCLTADALECIASVIVENPCVDFVYSDEDKIDPEGKRSEPFFKPAWSPTLLTSCNYITHLSAIRRTLVTEVGGFRDQTVGSQDHDLFLRVTERTRAVAHIPRVLYSWRMSTQSTALSSSAKPYAVDAARRSIEEALNRRGVDGQLTESHLKGLFIVRRPIPVRPSVSIVLDGSSEDWKSMLSFPAFDVQDVIVLDGFQDLAPNIAFAPSIEQARGEYLLFMDAASRPESQESAISLLEPLQDEGVACASGTTRLSDGMVLQAGVTLGDGGQPLYSYAQLPMFPQLSFYLNLKDLPREVSAVSIACSAMRAETWKALSGWNTELPTSLAMCDLSLRALSRGYRNVYMPVATFQRTGRLPALPAITPANWPWIDFQDPYSNPNLNPSRSDGLPFRRCGSRAPRVLPVCLERDG